MKQLTTPHPWEVPEGWARRRGAVIGTRLGGGGGTEGSVRWQKDGTYPLAPSERI